MTEIPLTQNQKTIIDDNDLELVKQLQWHVQKSKNTSYATASIKDSIGTKRVYLHRLLLQPPKGYIVVHKDGNGLNNRRENLELCKQGQTPRKLSMSPEKTYRGVHYIDEGVNRYKAVITISGKNTHLGSFFTAKEAAEARDAEAFKQWGSDARLNFPRSIQPPAKRPSTSGTRKEAK